MPASDLPHRIIVERIVYRLEPNVIVPASVERLGVDAEGRTLYVDTGRAASRKHVYLAAADPALAAYVRDDPPPGYGLPDLLADAFLERLPRPEALGLLGMLIAHHVVLADAIALAHDVGDTATEAMSLAVKAQVTRVLGRAEYMATLDRALALPQPAQEGWLHLSPRYLAVRFAVFDDRLEVAREDLLRMLALVERGGGEELVEVLRSLSEVSARSGRCRDALDFAGRAIRVAQEAGLSPGPAWYNAAIAELAGGSISRAAAYAERGCRASEQERDSIYLGRNLHALGQARLRGGDVRGGVETLRRIRALEQAQGVAEPSVLRWHSDLATGLVAIGELEEAGATIGAARAAVANRTHNAGVTARLDRAEALLSAEGGEWEHAVALLSGAVRRFELLGQPIERGHTLLVLGQVERRRRRHAAARSAVAGALAVFTEVGAKPWAEQAGRTLARFDGTSDGGDARREEPGGALAALTVTEARIASMVREGASNREIATRMFLSVKTVEATLTRIYRKLGVRSRTQLSSRLGSE